MVQKSREEVKERMKEEEEEESEESLRKARAFDDYKDSKHLVIRVSVIRVC